MARDLSLQIIRRCKKCNKRLTDKDKGRYCPDCKKEIRNTWLTIGGIAASIGAFAYSFIRLTDDIPTEKWFSEASDEDFYAAREEVRKKAIYDGDLGAESLLDLFNEKEHERLEKKYLEEHPDGGPGELPHREDGWYLLNDE